MLTGNPITTVRKQVFELPKLEFLHVRATAIPTLPTDVMFPTWINSWPRTKGMSSARSACLPQTRHTAPTAPRSPREQRKQSIEQHAA